MSENDCVLLEDNLEGSCFSKGKNWQVIAMMAPMSLTSASLGWSGAYPFESLWSLEVLHCRRGEKRTSSLLASWHALGEKMEMLIDFWTCLCLLWKERIAFHVIPVAAKMFYVGKQLRGVFCFCFFGFFFNGRKNMCDRPLQWWRLCPWGWSGPLNAFECFRCFWVHD